MPGTPEKQRIQVRRQRSANFTAGGRELFANRSREAGDSVLVKTERPANFSLVTDHLSLLLFPRGAIDRVLHPLSGGRAWAFRQLPAFNATIAHRFREMVRGSAKDRELQSGNPREHWRVFGRQKTSRTVGGLDQTNRGRAQDFLPISRGHRRDQKR